MATEYVLIPKHKYNQLEKKSVAPQNKHMGTSGGTNANNVDVEEEESSTTHSPLPVATPSMHGKQLHTKSVTQPQHGISKENHDDNDGDDDGNTTLHDSGDDNDDDDDDYDVYDILQSFKPTELKYVHPILNLIEANDSVLTWNRKSGEIIFLHKPIHNSNIVELLKDTLTANLHPTGKMEFYRGLDMMNVKLSNIKHPKNKSLLHIMGGEKKLRSDKRNVKKVKPTATVVTAKTNKTW